MDRDNPQKQPVELYPSLHTVIVTRLRDLIASFKVRRVLPSARRRMVGPFISLDQMGPEVLGKGARVCTSLPSRRSARPTSSKGRSRFQATAGTFEAGKLLVLKPGAHVTLEALDPFPARVILLGGEPMDDHRHIWWNFVSSSSERIEQAKEDWKAGRFAPVPQETESIPLPETGPVFVRYP